MDADDSRHAVEEVAPGLRNSPKRKRVTPWMDGNKFAETHGFYSDGFTPDEIAEREAWTQRMMDEKGNPTFAEQALIKTASQLNAILTRTWRAIENGLGAPAQEHLLALVNSFRLIMTAIGLERKQKSGPSLQEYLKQKEEQQPEQEKVQ